MEAKKLVRENRAELEDAPVDTKKIRFVSTKPSLTKDSHSRPGPIVKTLPDWYTKAEWFVPDLATGKPIDVQLGSATTAPMVVNAARPSRFALEIENLPVNGWLVEVEVDAVYPK